MWRFSTLRRPPANFHIVVFILAVRNRGMGQVWNCEQNISLAVFKVSRAVLKRGNTIANRSHLRNLFFCLLSDLLEPAYLLGNLVAPAAEFLNFLLGFSPPGVEREKFRQINCYTPSGQCYFYLFSVVFNKP